MRAGDRPVGDGAGTASAAPPAPAGLLDPNAVDVPRRSSEPAADAGRARSARREATRERVLDAARQVFAERGVIGGTVEDICEQAGFTRGAFYSNFADKDDVLRALIAREHSRLLAHVDAGFALLSAAGQGGLAAGAGSGGAPEPADTGGPASAEPRPVADPGADLGSTLAAMADRLLASVPADRQFSLVQTELEIHAVRDPETSRDFIDADARFRAHIAGFIDRGLHLLDRELVVDLGDATDAMIAIVERSTRRALLRGADADPNTLARLMLPLLIAAASRPAHSRQTDFEPPAAEPPLAADRNVATGASDGGSRGAGGPAR